MYYLLTIPFPCIYLPRSHQVPYPPLYTHKFLRKDIEKTKKKKGCPEKKKGFQDPKVTNMEKEKDFLKIHIPPTFGILHTCLIQ
jgi:hypothetical protein